MRRLEARSRATGFVLGTLLIFLGIGPAAAEVDEDLLRLFSENALSVNITARIFQGTDEIVWNMDLSRVTISGRAVKIRLDGTNIVVIAQFTPYRGRDDEVLLVAQGQTWILPESEDDLRYATAFESLPIRLGDTVLFYPLGRDHVTEETGSITLDVETEEFGAFNIELEIRVVPFTADSSH